MTRRFVSKLNARELADAADADISTSRALPWRPMIYRLRIEGERTRLMTLEAVLALSAGIVILPRTIEVDGRTRA